MHFRFPPAPRSGKIVVEAVNLSKSYGENVVLKSLDFGLERGEKAALIGKNGVGKTTLTKAIAGLISHDGSCNLGHNVELGYYGQNQTDELESKLTVLETIENEAVGDFRKQVRNLLGAFMFSGDDVYKPVKVLSGGEKARLALCRLLLQPYNFLILDEPTNHLDMASKEILKNALLEYDGTLLVVSHDRDFLSGLTRSVMELKDGRMTRFPGDITEFLDRKKAESIRSYEHSPKAKKQQDKSALPSAGKAKTGLSEKEKWKLSKRIGALEKEIESLENALLEIRKSAHSVEHSDHAALYDLGQKEVDLQSQLDRKMEAWSQVQERLEGAG